MNWIDIVIIVAIAISTFMGLRAGIIKSVLSLAGLIVGVILAGRYYVPFSEQLAFISQADVARVVAFAIILIVVLAIAAVLARFLKWAVSAIMLGWVNRLGGAIFGFVLGAIFCSALLAICIKFLGVAGVIAESGLASILLDRFPMVLALLPDEFDAIQSFFY
jgi:membrane protein required for colicin V production